MKKTLLYCLTLVLLFTTGCAAQTQTPEQTAQVQEEVAVDISQLDANMAYAQVYSILTVPDDYEGKTVRIYGSFSHYYDAPSDTDYFGVMIYDNVGCCTIGLDFVLAEQGLSYPDDYPQLGDMVTVEGVFETYTMDEMPDYLYGRLADCTMAA